MEDVHLSKAGLYIKTAIGLAIIGPFFGLFALAISGDLKFGIPVGLFLFAFVALVVLLNFFKMKRLLERNFRWYCRQYPNAIKGKIVLCNSCGSESIRVRGLMQRTYMREHFCGICGQVLYFSPEGR